MVVLLTCKKEDARVLTILYINFPGIQGPITPQSAGESGRSSTSSKFLWLFLLPAKIEKIQSEKKALECLQPFPHCKFIGFFFSNAQGQLTSQSVVGSGRILISFEIIWLSYLPARMKKTRSKMKALEC